MKLYIFGEWTSVFTGNSNRFISYDISNGTIVSVLPSLVSPASGGPMHPYSATEILFDKNNRVFLLEWLGQSAHARHSPGKEAPSISGALITDSGYSDW